MRICVLTKADTLSWTQHYVDAFRQRADVLTVGPGIGAKQIEDWNLGDLVETLIPNDIEADLDPDQELRRLLPEGWTPDLIVTIANGGVSLQPQLTGLTCPTAYITVDTWQSISDYVECQHYDFVFAVQRSCVEHLRAVGASNVHWLPLGCNPETHYPVDVPRDYDISFVGNVVIPVHQHRLDLLQRLETTFPTFVASRLFRDDLCRAIACGKLVFNQSAVHEVNMRVFEVMAMGRPLLTNRESERNGLTELFEDGKHLILYDGEQDLVDKVRYYLDHDEEREAIALAGHQLAIRRHRYVDRVDTLLATVKERVPSFRDGSDPAAAVIADTVANLVPYGAGRVVDVGLELQPHLRELRLRGASEIIGMTSTMSEGADSTYDQVVSTSGVAMSPVDADVLLLSSTKVLGKDCLNSLDRAYGMLAAGGTLILRLSAADFSTATGITSLNLLEEVFAARGFHVTACTVEEAGATSVIVRARKRTRQLAEVVEESCAHLPHVDTAGFAKWAAAYGPNY